MKLDIKGHILCDFLKYETAKIDKLKKQTNRKQKIHSSQGLGDDVATEKT